MNHKICHKNLISFLIASLIWQSFLGIYSLQFFSVLLSFAMMTVVRLQKLCWKPQKHPHGLSKSKALWYRDSLYGRVRMTVALFLLTCQFCPSCDLRKGTKDKAAVVMHCWSSQTWGILVKWRVNSATWPFRKQNSRSSRI